MSTRELKGTLRNWFFQSDLKVEWLALTFPSLASRRKILKWWSLASLQGHRVDPHLIDYLKLNYVVPEDRSRVKSFIVLYQWLDLLNIRERFVCVIFRCPVTPFDSVEDLLIEDLLTKNIVYVESLSLDLSLNLIVLPLNVFLFRWVIFLSFFLNFSILGSELTKLSSFLWWFWLRLSKKQRGVWVIRNLRTYVLLFWLWFKRVFLLLFLILLLFGLNILLLVFFKYFLYFDHKISFFESSIISIRFLKSIYFEICFSHSFCFIGFFFNFY